MVLSVPVMWCLARYSTFSSDSSPPGGRENTPMSTISSIGSSVSLPLPAATSLAECTFSVSAYLPSARLVAVASTARLSKNTMRSNMSRISGWYFSSRSEEHTSELQSLMRISYAVFCLKKKKIKTQLKDEDFTNIQRYNTRDL